MRRWNYALWVGLAWCLLWPYYQRSYYRVTLFYQLGEGAAQACFALFAVATLAAWIAVALRPDWLRRLLRESFGVVPLAGAASLVATAYLAGLVAPSVQGIGAVMLNGGAALLFAGSLLVISSAAVKSLMAVAYGDGLFVAVLALVASAVVGRILSPSFFMSPISTGVVPVGGMAGASAALGMAWRLRRSIDDNQPGYLPLSQAPHKAMWLTPLVAYGLLVLVHAVGFLNDASSEMHIEDGTLRAAPFSAANYVVFMLFCLLFSGAAINALRTKAGAWKRAVAWVAVIGVAVGLFCGAFLMSLTLSFGADRESFPVLSGGTMCLIVLVAVVVLFMTYQNRLAPLSSFGLFFFGVYAAEKVLTYVILPVVMQPWLASLNAIDSVLNTAVFVLTLAVLLLFLVQLCRNDALLMLFSDGAAALEGSLGAAAVPDRRLKVCEELARRHGLTAREGDILYNLSLGHSARHIADALCISERTVQTHVQNVYRKLGVHARQEVIDLVGQHAQPVS